MSQPSNTNEDTQRSRAELFLYAALIVVAGLAYAAYFQWGRAGSGWLSSSITLPPPPEGPQHNLIAFVGPEGEIWKVTPDGAEQQSVTRDGRGYWRPLWSPDGRWLGFSGGDIYGAVGFFVSPVDRSAPTPIVIGEFSRPHFVSWSQDGSTLFVLSTEYSGWGRQWRRGRVGWEHVLRSFDITPPGESTVLASGRFDSLAIPSHRQHVLVIEGSELACLPAGEGASTDVRVANVISGGSLVYSLDEQGVFINRIAPLDEWTSAAEGPATPAADSPASQKAVTAMESPEHASPPAARLVFHNLRTGNEKPIADLQRDEIARVTRSPRGNVIAYQVLVDSDSSYRLSQARAMIFDPERDPAPRELLYPALSLVWSPDGKKLAMLCRPSDVEGTPQEGPRNRRVSWIVYNIETGEHTSVYTFTLAEGMRGMLQDFDTYARVWQIWSPDSRYLLANAQEERKSVVWVLDSTGQQPPLELAEGMQPTWSWQ